jgi:hypothetical protein
MKPHRYPHTSTKTKLNTVTVSSRLYNLVKLFVEQDCLVARALHKAFHLKRYQNPKNPFNFCTVREKQGMISYMPIDKEQTYSDEGKWKREGRQEIKPAKFLKEFVHPRILAKFKDHEIADFATKFKAFEASQMLEFKVVDVADVYVAKNFFREETFGSCMMDKPVGDFYSCFDVSAVAAVRKSGEWVGRALLWNEVKSGGETHSLLDRIYARNVEITELFLQWAKANNHWVKVGQNNNSFEFKRPDDTVFSGQSYVRALKDISDQRFFPYMDTFAGSDRDDENIFFNREDGVITYRNTDGTRDHEDEEVTIVTIDGDRIPSSEAVYLGGEYYSQGDDRVVFSDYTGDYLHIDDAVYSDDSDDWFPAYCVSNGTLVLCQDNEQYYRSNSREIVKANDGLYYLKDSDSIVWSEGMSKYILADGAVKVDGDYYPETSTDIIFCEEENKYILRDKSNDPPPPVDESTDNLRKSNYLMENIYTSFIASASSYGVSRRTLQGTWTFESEGTNW